MQHIDGRSSESTSVPSTLHGQLYLLTFDPEQGRFDVHDPALFGFALQAAMLADLYLMGFLVERGGRAVPGKAASPDDPILRAAFAQVGVHNRATWAQLVARNAREAISAVQEQLTSEGWLRGGSLEPYDEYRVRELIDDVGDAVRTAIAGYPAEPWLLSCGLLALLAGLPGLADFVADAEDTRRLDELTREAIAPVAGLAEAIRSHRQGGTR